MKSATGENGVEGEINRIELAVALVLQLGIAAVTIGALFESQWILVFSGTVVLLLTITPAMLEHQLRIQLPVEFTLITRVVLFASLRWARYAISMSESGGGILYCTACRRWSQDASASCHYMCST